MFLSFYFICHCKMIILKLKMRKKIVVLSRRYPSRALICYFYVKGLIIKLGMLLLYRRFSKASTYCKCSILMLITLYHTDFANFIEQTKLISVHRTQTNLITCDSMCRRKSFTTSKSKSAPMENGAKFIRKHQS